MQSIENYINGELRPPIGGNYIDNVNPATGEVYCRIPASENADAELAVEAADAAFPGWSSMAVGKRSKILLEVARLIERNLDRLAEAETTDNGKPLTVSKTVDIPRASLNFEFYATAALHDHTEAHSMGTHALNYTQRMPVGVAACISPWNLPLYLFSWKIAPALAAGCTVVAKPSEITPMTAYLLSELCQEAGLPAGVLNIIHGYGQQAAAPLVSHPRVKAISFTGGTKTGAGIAATAAPMFKKLSLELGGKNPNLVFADADYELALKTSVQAAFSNQGQICLCGSRILVEAPVYEKFVADFAAMAANLKVGDPLDPATQVGAIVSRPHYQKIQDYIQIAKEEGGEIITGGKAVHPEGRCSKGFFIEPTVITGLEAQCRTNQEEIFGPVVTIMPFETEAEAVALANSTVYGLSATLFTSNLQRAHRVAHVLHSGIVWVNCWLLRDLRTPFGGMKHSGVGREGGFEALHFFTEEKNVCIKL